MDWQKIDQVRVDIGGGYGFIVIISRAKVPGGWLILATGQSTTTPTSLTFYPDIEHLWDGTSLPD